MQPKLASAEIGFSNTASLKEIEHAIGPLISSVMISTTDQTIEVIRSAFAKLTAVKVAFRAHAVQQFNTTNFIDFKLPETYGLSPNEPPPPVTEH